MKKINILFGPAICYHNVLSSLSTEQLEYEYIQTRKPIYYNDKLTKLMV